MSGTMRAIVVHGPGDIRFDDVPIPKVDVDSVLVKVHYSGICGTDLDIYTGLTVFVEKGLVHYPVRIGHEWSGVVVETGSEVTEFAPGDRVVSATGFTCGKCPACKRRDWQHCIDSRPLGTIRDCYDGSFAEYILVPERHLYHMDANISMKAGALVEPASIAMGGLDSVDFATEKNILIIGTGAIGLSAVALAKAKGAKKTILAGRTPSKLAIGQQLGADYIINSSTEDLEKVVKELTDGKGVDAVIEASGSLSALEQVPSLLRVRGIAVILAFYETASKHFDINELSIRGLRFCGAAGRESAVPEVLSFMSEGRIDLLPIITGCVPFLEALTTFEQLANKQIYSIKTIVEFPAAVNEK